MTANEAGWGLGSSLPGTGWGELDAAVGASLLLARGLQVASGFGGEGQKGSEEGYQEVIQPLAIIPLFNAVKDPILE